MQKILGQGIILAIIIGISLFANLSQVAAEGPMDEMADYASAHEDKSTIPQNCLTPASPLCSCIPNNAADNVVLPSRQFTPNDENYLNLSPAGLTGDIVPNIPRIPQHVSAPELLPSRPGAEYRCRDGLNSEEPPQV